MKIVVTVRPPSDPKVIALSGGIGGGKLAVGLSRVLESNDLLIVANTGDDFEHLGLHISPDIDSLVYAMAGLNDPERGWGRKEETWHFMEALSELRAPDWFRLGDRDLATHVLRTHFLAQGHSLSEVTATLARRRGISHLIVPMTDQPVRTKVLTSIGEMDFQRYFVAEGCRPLVTGFRFAGAEDAVPHPAFLAALESPRLEAIVICPSNPFISIDPILALPGVRQRIAASSAPVIAVSPIVGGRAIKGPAAKMMAELRMEVSAEGAARHFDGLLDGFVLDHTDAALAPRIRSLSCAIAVTATRMTSDGAKTALARAVLGLAERLGARARAA